MPRRTPIVSSRPQIADVPDPDVTPPESPKSIYDRTAGAGLNRIIELPAVPDGEPIYGKPCHCCGTVHAGVCHVCGNRHLEAQS